ncbi:uncharacterized protein LOC113233151 isoform X2 [Hyposmocoma kahamanoa]|uniref:uncharacterized protein LOC113233151 isoform X2 n=1 Tax=Hyposmocoma kahamanoa TaxID=1477025 RepID=UPI000E6D64B8|nr:uncharacterized protein LOC113233151 isoform X2 [Hyposmocoma kahamanoa]
MSSYSSDSDYSCPYGAEFTHQTPFYASMGQPLVYYAQVRGYKKNNPNCFVKAFRWYTQDHKPQSQRVEAQCCKPDVSEFATWLDIKYEQFLAEQAPQGHKQLKNTQTSVIVSGNTCCKNCGPCPDAKRFERLKSKCISYSPWKKYRRQTQQQNPNERNLQEQTGQSMEYILSPKNISRAASECYHPSPVSILETQVPTNVKRKSQSATNVSPNTGPCIDIVTNHEGPPAPRPKQSTTSLKIEVQKPTTKYQKPSENFAKNKIPTTINRSCTCCVRVNTTDAETQCEFSVETFVPTSYEVPSEVSMKKRRRSVIPNYLKHDKRTKEVFCQYSEFLEGTQCSTKKTSRVQCKCPDNSHIYTNIKVEPPPPTPLPPPIQQEKLKICICPRQVHQSSRTVYETSTAQTSNRSINLENDIMLCPLLLKIVCADKPLKGCMCDEK